MVLKYLKYRKVLRWLCGDHISWSIFSFSLFVIMGALFRYEKPYAA